MKKLTFLIITTIFFSIACNKKDTSTPNPKTNNSTSSFKTDTPSPTSMAEKISTMDGNLQNHDIQRTQSLLDQLTSKYNLTETEVADKIVVCTYKALRDKYGINQKLKDSMEDLNRINFPNPRDGDFDKLSVAYVQMRNAGQSRQEAISRLNTALSMDNRSLDVFLNQ